MPCVTSSDALGHEFDIPWAPAGLAKVFMKSLAFRGPSLRNHVCVCAACCVYIYNEI